MALRLANLRLSWAEPESALPNHITRALAISPSDIQSWRILRKSLDSRDKNNLQWVFSVEVNTFADEKQILQLLGNKTSSTVRIDHFQEPEFAIPTPGTTPMDHRPIIVGSGPAGLAAGFFLAQQGYRPLILERGKAVRDRIRDVHRFDDGGPLDPESNYLFGEGGAGTFSDGKLTCRSSGPDVKRILQLFAECKGKPSVVYDQRPHLGSNRLPAVVKAMRRQIEAMGGEIRFSCRVEDIDIRDGRLFGVATSSGYVPTNVVLLGVGHSARDTFQMLEKRGVPMAQKPFQFGVRIEHPQEIVNRVQYGPSPIETQLGAADYTLVAKGPHDLFSFCMCAGGQIIPSVSDADGFCTNGMSLSKRDLPFANSGFVVTIPIDQFGGTDVMAGVRLQQRYEQAAFELSREQYACPIQRVSDYLSEKQTKSKPISSYTREVLTLADIHGLVPPVVNDALHHGLPILNRKWQGRFMPSATMVGPEARGSSPIRIIRDTNSRESPGVVGLYPIGEGAGYAGGIVSAAVDGLQTAKAVIGKYQKS